jgi:hypothetical protein
MIKYIKSAPCVQNIFYPQNLYYYKIIRPYSSLFLAFFRVLDRIHYLIKNLVGKKSIVNPLLLSSKNPSKLHPFAFFYKTPQAINLHMKTHLKCTLIS